MKFAIGLISLAAMASAMSLTAPSNPISVKLEPAGGTLVNATITNHGPDDLKVQSANTIFDEMAPVKRVDVTSEGIDCKANFTGVYFHLAENLPDKVFNKLPAGQSISTTIDVAETHAMCAGNYTVKAKGFIPCAEGDSTKIFRSVPYESNEVWITVDDEAARLSQPLPLQKRVKLDVASCNPKILDRVKTAISDCKTIAKEAQHAALKGDAALMEAYFKSSRGFVRKPVGDIFGRVADVCSSFDSGDYVLTCQDFSNFCNRYGKGLDAVQAYTVPYYKKMAICQPWLGLPAISDKCNEHDRANVLIHEATHLTQVAETVDKGYGIGRIRQLDSEDNLKNADSYTLFANAVHNKCKP